ncbi:MAG TPA: hypothetical protein VEL76_07705 [Gemmataceae bacterium]|nr:hypothetical protein [Gemmataceae bacterium]
MAKQDRELRDWFAGQALKGLLAGPNAPKKSKAEATEQYAVRVAEEAYLFADAMMQVAKLPPASAQHAEEEAATSG